MGRSFVENKTVLVTGATDGIGFETAKQLAEMGAHVLMHGRNKEKAIEAITKISRGTCEGTVDLYLADFSSVEDIKRMADDIKREKSEMHVLVNNAGNFYTQRQVNDAAVELTWMVNHLAPFLLTMQLLDLVKASAPARIVNVASSAHKMVKEVDFENLQGEKNYDPYHAYALSKLGNILITNVLAKRLHGTGVTANALHPGVVATKLLKKSYDLNGVSPEDGAATQMMLASSEDITGITGKYFKNSHVNVPSDLASNEALQERIWRISEEMIGDFLK